MGRRSPTPREIRHFYVLRQSGHGGTYYLQSTAVENWIPEGVSNPGQVEISSDKKKIGFYLGFPHFKQEVEEQLVLRWWRVGKK
jgi:hypothetical protein